MFRHFKGIPRLSSPKIATIKIITFKANSNTLANSVAFFRYTYRDIYIELAIWKFVTSNINICCYNKGQC